MFTVMYAINMEVVDPFKKEMAENALLFDLTIRNSDKLKHIRQTALNFNSDTTGIAQRILDETHSVKVAISFADTHHDFEFVKQNLINANKDVCHYTLKYPWIYTQEYVANEEFILNVVPLVGYAARIKIFNGLGRWLLDTEVADKLYEVAKCNYSSRMAAKMLSACSEDVIKQEAEKGRLLTDAQLLIVLRRDLDKGKAIIKIILAKIGSKDHKNACHYFLCRAFDEGFEILVENKCFIDFGYRRTQRLVSIYNDPKNKIIQSDLESKIISFTPSLKRKCLQNLPSETYERLYISHVIEDTPPNIYSMDCEHLNLIKCLPKNTQQQFMEHLYVSKFGRRPVEVPGETFPEMLHLLSDEDRITIVNTHLANEETSTARGEKPEYFWIAMKPLRLAVEELKNLLNDESTSDEKVVIFRLLVISCIYSKDYAMLPELMSDMIDNSKGDDYWVRQAIASKLDSIDFDEVEDLGIFWKPFRELVELRYRLDRAIDYTFNKPCFRIAKRIGISDLSFLQEMASLMASFKMNHEYYYTGFIAEELKDHKGKEIRDIFLETCLRVIEERLSSTRQWEYGYEALNFLETWRDLNHNVDITKYPACHELLRVTLFDKTEWWMAEKEPLAMFFLARTLMDEDEETLIDVKNCASMDSKDLVKMAKTGKLLDVDSGMRWLQIYRCEKKNVALRKVDYLTSNDSALRKKIINMCERIILDTDTSQVKNGYFFLLAIMMDTEDYLKVIEPYIPKNPSETRNRTAEDVDRCIAAGRSLRFLKNPTKAFETILIFLESDYSKHVLGAFDSLCSTSPVPVVVSFLEAHLFHPCVSVQRYIIRWYFRICGRNQKGRLMDLFSNSTVGSIKREVIKVILRQYTDDPEEFWPILSSCLNHLTIEDRQAIYYFFEFDEVEALLGCNTKHLFEVVLKLVDCSAQLQEDFEATIMRCASNIIGTFDDGFAIKLLRRSFQCAKLSEWPFYCEYWNNFVLKDSVDNSEEIFLKEFQETITPGCTKRVLQIPLSLAKEIVLEKANTGVTAHGHILERLINILMVDAEEWFASIVALQMYAVMYKVIPEKILQREGKNMDHQYVREFLDGCVSIVEYWTEKYDIILLDIICEKFKELLGTFTRTSNKFLELSKNHTPGKSYVKDMTLVRCISYYTVEEKDKLEFDAILKFKNNILQSNDCAAKILIRHTG